MIYNTQYMFSSPKPSESGFALYVSIIFMSVMLSIALTLASLAYKEQELVSGGIASQEAFYTADAALECALYFDQQVSPNPYAYSDTASAPAISCYGVPANKNTMISRDATNKVWVISSRIQIGANCADIQVKKYLIPPIGKPGTYLFAQGYSIPCSTLGALGINSNNIRFASRGISEHY